MSIANMGDQTQANAALLTEHFRWTPLSLLDDIINSINALLYHAVSAVENGLLNAPPASLGFRAQRSGAEKSKSKDENNGHSGGSNEEETEELMYARAKAEIDDGVHQLETLLESTVDKNFDKLELYVLRNVLAVPDDVASWMRLGHYEDLDFEKANAASPASPTRESVEQQRRKLRETQKLQLALLQETARHDALIVQLRTLLTAPPSDPASVSSTPSPFAFLTSNSSAAAHSLHPPSTTATASTGTSVTRQAQNPLTTTASFTMAQLPSLRALLGTLRPKLAAWSSTSGDHHPQHAPSKEADDVRTAYIESQVKHHLMSNRGLELDEQGAPREGEGAGAYGRKVAGQEVADLERVVTMLGKNSRRSEQHETGGQDDDRMDESGI